MLLLEDFGKIGVDRLVFWAVLEGTCVAPPGCMPTTIKLLSRLRQPPKVIKIDMSYQK